MFELWFYPFLLSFIIMPYAVYKDYRKDGYLTISDIVLSVILIIVPLFNILPIFYVVFVCFSKLWDSLDNFWENVKDIKVITRK